MTLSQLRVGELLAALGERTPAPASGSAIALTGALAAALVELAARFADDAAAVARAQTLGARLAALADEDAEAYTAFLSDRTAESRRRTIDVPEEIAARADEVASLAVHVRAQLRTSVAGDAEAGEGLARAAAAVARGLAWRNGAADGATYMP